MTNSILRVLFVAVISITSSGCATYSLKAKYNNGGDVPPILTIAEVRSGSFELQPGDTVAVVNGQLLKSTATRVDLMSKTGRAEKPDEPKGPSKMEAKSSGLTQAKDKRKQAKEERPSKFDFKARKAQKESQPSKSERKSSSDRPSKFSAKTAMFRKPEDSLTKEQKKDKRKQEKDENPSKMMAKFGMLSKERPAKVSELVLLKRVAKADEANPEYAEFLVVREDKDVKVANFEIALQNVGEADFVGDVVIYDRLPDGMSFASVQAVGIKRNNAIKTGAMFVPIYGWIAQLFLSSEKFEAFDESQVFFSQEGQMLKLRLSNITIPEGKRAAFEFNVGL